MFGTQPRQDRGCFQFRATDPLGAVGTNPIIQYKTMVMAAVFSRTVPVAVLIDAREGTGKQVYVALVTEMARYRAPACAPYSAGVCRGRVGPRVSQ